MIKKITIITAVYNRDRFIENCIVSTLGQDFATELVVIDGGSTDQTLTIINKYQNQISCLISEKDFGIYDALNKGILNSTGEIIGILHSDDFFASNNILTEVARTFDSCPDIDMLIGNAAFVSNDDPSKIIRRYRSDRFKLFSMRFGFMPCHTASFVRKDVFKRFGLYDIKFKSASDFDFFLRTIFVGRVNYKLLKDTLVYMRVGGMSTSGILSYLRTTREIILSLKKNDIYSNIFFVSLRLPIKYILYLYEKYSK